MVFEKFIKKSTALLLSSISLFGMSSCDDDEYKDKEYTDYEEYYLNDINDFYAEDGNYLVYCFFPTCPDCKKIKSSIMRYIDNTKENEELPRMYLLDVKPSSTEEGKQNRNLFKEKHDEGNDYYYKYNNDLTNNIKSIEETYFFGVPSLYEVKDNTLYSFTIGSDKVPTRLETF